MNLHDRKHIRVCVRNGLHFYHILVKIWYHIFTPQGRRNRSGVHRQAINGFGNIMVGTKSFHKLMLSILPTRFPNVMHYLKLHRAHNALTHRAWTKWSTFCRRHFQCIFMEWKCFYFVWYFVDLCSHASNLTISQHWWRSGLGGEQGTSHWQDQWWHSSLVPTCVIRPLWINTLRSGNEFITVGETLSVQVMNDLSSMRCQAMTWFVEVGPWFNIKLSHYRTSIGNSIVDIRRS